MQRAAALSALARHQEALADQKRLSPATSRRVSISRSAQEADLKEIRAEFPEFAAVH
jgi:hypothetical protein